MSQNTSQCFIAYFDILGYKAFFENNENDVQAFLRDSISLAKDMSEETKIESNLSDKIRYKLFSDNCIVVVKDETNKVVLQRLIDLIGSLQLKFLRKYKIPIRGGITRGQIYLDDEIVFGAGLVEAVNLESHKAIYPRMVIDSKLYSDEHLTENLNNVKIDFDGQRYIDYFSLLTVSDIYSPKPDEKKEVCEVRNSVFDLVEKYGHYDKRETRPEKIDENTKNILKYLWLVMKYNEVVVAKGFPTQIKYDISISEKFMRFELTNLQKNPWPVIAN